MQATRKPGTEVMIMMRLESDTNEDPQYAIFMITRARLKAEDLGDFLPNLCLLITSESLNFGNMFPPVHGYSELCQLMLEIRLIT